RVLLLVAVAALAAGCSGDGADATQVVEISMQDSRFEREVTRVEVGDTIRFTNDGQVEHNAIDVDGAWSTGEATGGGPTDLLEPGETVELTFDEPGEFDFYCSLHAPDDASSGMAGTLVVGDVGSRAGADADVEVVEEGTGTTRRVPRDHPTIQNAVDAAEPGDLVLVAPAPEEPAYEAEDGRYVYRESVEITTPYITLRGTDRNEVIVDAEHQRENAIATFAADGVVVENLTARNATGNGIYWTSVEGYRGSYLTASNNATYGIYAFDSTDGLFEHSYASGSGDAGFYIGQCEPCDAVIREVTAERNGLGYSGTNASDVYLLDSLWRYNTAGIVPNTLDSQRFAPHGNVTIVGNLIHDNDERTSPALGGVWPSFGTGVMLAGGHDSLVARNRIVNHVNHGVAVSPNLSDNFWMSGGNVVRDNVIEGSGYSDLTLSGPAMADNCFMGNDAGATQPAGLQRLAGCGPDATAGAHAGAGDPDRGRFGLPVRSSLASTLASVGLVAEVGLGIKPDVDHREVPPPPALPTLPRGPDAPVEPAVDVFDGLDVEVAALTVPDQPDGLAVGRGGVIAIGGVPFGTGALPTVYAVLGWALPFGLFAAWLALALVDLARREDLNRGGTVGWTAGVLLVPFVGAAGYLLAGRSTLPAVVRWLAVAGGLGLVVALLVGAVVVGGVL
ncbi:MAG: right-handed parallel beta-helix repeat-containing protein, partial [Nitriliruptoraceae bacterium]